MLITTNLTPSVAKEDARYICLYCNETVDYLSYLSPIFLPKNITSLGQLIACEKCKHLIEWCDEDSEKLFNQNQ